MQLTSVVIKDNNVKDLIEFFSLNQNNLKTFIDIVYYNRKDIPLRVYNWFVQNYIKKNDVTYLIGKPHKDIQSSLKIKLIKFNVYRSYQAQILGSHKTQFDPYCRCSEKTPTITFEQIDKNGEKTLVKTKIINLEYIDEITNEKINIETTYSQLNFFRWAIKNLVVDYVEANKDKIYKDLIENEKTKKIGNNKKKTEISKSIYKNYVVCYN